MSLAMKARQKVKRKGASKDRVFGCDLVEHLQFSGQEVPQVLKSCTEFVEQHGIVDGIYRLSGISSNTQKLRQEFDTERNPDLNKEMYLQDIHCVSSLCKAYFRELPNPLLTYQLYDKFADAVAIQLEEERLVKIKEVLKELPLPHYRTLEFLMKHLIHMASFCSETNMHARNLAIVWAPNLLRSKDIEASGFNGTAAFMEVRVQSIVVEFILTHVQQLFQDAPLGTKNESYRKSLHLAGMPPTIGQDDIYFHSLSINVPSILNQGDGPPQIRPYHTIIDIAENKRKGSLKAKKWRSIFNLGRSGNDSKRKSAKMDEKEDKSSKMNLRPAKSMDSLSSMPYANEDHSNLMKKRPPNNQVPFRHGSIGPCTQPEDSQNLMESDEYPQEKSKGEESQNLSEFETESTTKSEPTTPKAGRASLVGTPQGRSPKAARNRAEKCAGVHISGPFSVTVPFHITSNLTLSRLTRGLECPALNYSIIDRTELENSSSQEDDSSNQKEVREPQENAKTEDNAEKKEVPESSRNLRLSMEVQDSFSFLDSQDGYLETSLPELCGNGPADVGDLTTLEQKMPQYVEDSMGCFLTTSDMLEEDIRSGFMNTFTMQMEEFSVEPPPDDLSSDDDGDQMYYMATGCCSIEELSREAEENSEDVFLSAFDDLSPLARDAQIPQELSGDHILDVSKKTADVHLRTMSEGVEPATDGPLTSTEAAEMHLPSPCENSTEMEQCHLVDPRAHLDQLEKLLKNMREDTVIDSPPVNQKAQEVMSVDEGAPDIETHCLFSAEYPKQYGSEKSVLCTSDPIIANQREIQNTETRGHPNEENVYPEQPTALLNQSEEDQATAPSCVSFVEADFVSLTGNQGGATFLDQEKWITDDKDTSHPLNTEDVWSLDAPVDTAVYELGKLEPTGFPQTPESKSHSRVYPDGSVSMKIASTVARIQQVKSVPVVPPKPQFAKLPPALKSKIHVGPASVGNKETGLSPSGKHNKPEKSYSVDISDSPAPSLQKQRQSSWRNGGSMSFDAAVALAKERQSSQHPVRRMQTYCAGDSHETHGLSETDKSLHIPKLVFQPGGHRSGRPLSCINCPSSLEYPALGMHFSHEAPGDLALECEQNTSQDSLACAQELPIRNRFSMPKLGQKSDMEDTLTSIHQQRRSLV
ncbi:rho GTPase-activating protein 30 isoform X3 [Microcaecilia unicolor]|uniref:Rho GTPase-activating protein 30 isoform X3 n=1 Tax=Microcaecilia unicolor TaxID=1415580 RepID=A0A6P7WZY4_9AMPH|nr:rho GTPase-activating protein 30 isoform X3 [Microcaecilia unicolor]